MSLIRLTAVNFEGDLCWSEATVYHRLEDRLERRIAQLSQLIVTQIDFAVRSEIHCNTHTTNESINYCNVTLLVTFVDNYFIS